MAEIGNGYGSECHLLRWMGGLRRAGTQPIWLGRVGPSTGSCPPLVPRLRLMTAAWFERVRDLRPLLDDLTEDRLLAILDEALAALVVEELHHA